MLKFITQLFSKPKEPTKKQKILIFCGAGISAESGLSTFRDSDGLWSHHNVLDICNLNTFEKNKDLVFDFYNARKLEVIKAVPNIAHTSIANIQKTYGMDNVHIFTSNIDDLLEKAGCTNVVHVHGDCQSMKCLDCGHILSIGDSPYDKEEICPKCESNSMKPNIIFFNEVSPTYKILSKAFESSGEIINHDIVPNIKLFVGTSFKVLSTSVFYTQRGNSILVDLHPSKHTIDSFNTVISQPATIGMIEAESLIKKLYR